VIVTVTLNAALDRTLVAPGFALGQSRTVERALSLGGGKGLNVARALRGLHCPVLALGLAGGETGAAIRRALDLEGIPSDLTRIRDESRTCTAIIDPSSGISSEINEPGPKVEEDELAPFLDRFERAIPDACLIALSGSLPNGVPDDFYAVLIERARRAEVPCILDSRGAALRRGLAAGPLLAKPNQHEAAELLGGDFDHRDRAVLARFGASIAVITLGPAGAVLHGPAGSWRAIPPPIQPIDTVGAGDCFVGGLCAAFLAAAGTAPVQSVIDQPGTLEKALRLATAAAAANTLTVGAGLFLEKDLLTLQERVIIQKIE
jgi:1-phosphofructokinase family hexose kinase